MVIRVYVCPTEGCGNFYGSSSMGDLASIVVGQKGINFEDRPASMWHSRAQCPDCKSRGLEVERQLVILDPELRPAVVDGSVAA